MDGAVFDFSKCDAVEAVTKERRALYKNRHDQRSSGYSTNYSDMSEIEEGALRAECANVASSRQSIVVSDTNSSSSCDSESGEEEKRDDAYRVERQEESVLRIKPSQQPRLYTSRSTLCDDNKFVFGTVDGANNVCPDAEYNTGPPSSVEKSSAGYEIKKRKSAYLRINKNVDFCRIQTVEYKHNHKKSIQHYKKNLKPEERDIEGNIGVRDGDLLLEVNGKKLLDRKQKSVVKIFEKIRPKHSDGIILINLRYRRWETRKTGNREADYEVDYVLQLELEPIFVYENEYERALERENDPPAVSEKTAVRLPSPVTRRHKKRPPRSCNRYRVSSGEIEETNQTMLPKGNIIDVHPTSKKWYVRIKCKACGPDEYLTADKSGTVLLSVPLSSTKANELFQLDTFNGDDTAPEPLSIRIFCVRIIAPDIIGAKYLSSQLEQGYSDLCFQPSVPVITTASQVDETCFILRELGNQIMLESLLKRGYFIGCERREDRKFKLTMVHKSYDDIIHEHNTEDVKFEFYYDKGKEIHKKSGVVERLVHQIATLGETL